MSDYKYPNKTSFVKVFGLKRVRIMNEGESAEVYERTYRHPSPSIRAYCRMVVADSSDTQTVSVGRERVLVVINYREGVKMGDYVQWGKRTLKIVAVPDYFEGRGTELKLLCEPADDDPHLMQIDAEEAQ